MNHQPTQPARPAAPDTRALERTQQQFLLARAQLAAGRAEPRRTDAVRLAWSPHERRIAYG